MRPVGRTLTDASDASIWTPPTKSLRIPCGDPLPNAPNDFSGRHYSARMDYGFSFGKFSVQSDRRDDLVNYLLQAAKLLESNPNCIY